VALGQVPVRTSRLIAAVSQEISGSRAASRSSTSRSRAREAHTAGPVAGLRLPRAVLHTRRRYRQKRNRPGGPSSFAALRAQSIPSRFCCFSGAHANRHLLLSRSRRNICCEPWQTMDAPHAVSDADDEPWRKPQRIALALSFVASCREAGTGSGLRFKGGLSKPLERRKVPSFANIHYLLSDNELLLFIV